MAVSSIQRILTHVRKPTQHNFSRASFKTCIFCQLGIEELDEESCKVKCHLKDNKLCLELASQTGDKNSEDYKEGFILKHPRWCPVLAMNEEESNSLPEESVNRGVDVGIAVLVESSDECILITRRASHMRTFPGVWVPPGGHVEDGETMEEAGLREVSEETGLTIPQGIENPVNILALWESVYPSILSKGLPLRHHIVVYLHIRLAETSMQINNGLKLNPDEADAALWLPLVAVNSLILDSKPTPPQKKVTYLELDPQGKTVSEERDLSSIFSNVVTMATQNQRMSTGTRFAIEMWCRKKAKLPYPPAVSSNL